MPCERVATTHTDLFGVTNLIEIIGVGVRVEHEGSILIDGKDEAFTAAVVCIGKICRGRRPLRRSETAKDSALAVFDDDQSLFMARASVEELRLRAAMFGDAIDALPGVIVKALWTVGDDL